MSEVIGIAGVGRMGSAFAQRLIGTGHQVRVWNRNPDRCAPAVAAGAEQVDMAGLAACPVIITSLADDLAVSQITKALIDAGLGDGLLIEMSTLLPSEAAALAQQVGAAGVEFLHAPVGGTVEPALKGQLLGMAGGSAAAFARARPVLDHLCRRVEYLGTPEAAARMKLAINLPLAIYWQTLGEALALLRGAGIAPELAISMIADSSAGPTVLKNRQQVVVDTLAGQDLAGTFDLAGLAKDLNQALVLARGEGADMPLSDATAPRYARALEQGHGGLDGASLSRRAAGWP
ncbi:NAD(P)-dependent oxidoreductase [Paracoccus sp. MBLB3053]|uniref:NAD(P)-dependent oxidoreductase n=1 Tax=Paracoccus aurantius TaxID=3073814 RepID=A0ABU2HX33_9RHOB|nr:NAD(P)-dependent oxidoreductase [Paracoccus sp. MBLB3053]MDS9469578.1 NAD(P)-dependent oxidoreductase [Paracoccus sp. MBLB3053]